MVWKLQIVIDVWNSCSEKLFRSALVWNLLSFVNFTQNFIWWLVNGMKTSDCHHLNMSPSEKIIHFHINMNMSPYDLSPNAYYSYQSPFWYEILRWWQVWILHTKPSYGDICHHMEAWYEKFSYLSPKKPFRWWRSERFYHRVAIPQKYRTKIAKTRHKAPFLASK